MQTLRKYQRLISAVMASLFLTLMLPQPAALAGMVGTADVLAAEQTPMSDNWFQGTADAVRQSMHHFLGHEWDYALILSGDQLYQMDYNFMLDQHEKANADISIATIPVNAKEATSFGILKSDEKNEITSFINDICSAVVCSNSSSFHVLISCIT